MKSGCVCLKAGYARMHDACICMNVDEMVFLIVSAYPESKLFLNMFLLLLGH